MFSAPSVDPNAVAKVRDALRVTAATAKILVARGLDDDATLAAFMSPRLSHLRRPEGLPDFARAVSRLRQAVLAQECVGVFGDYDVDGVTSSALVAGFLRQLAADVIVDVAARDMGYGLSVAAMQAMLDAGCKVVVATDCGTSDHEALQLAAAAGVDVIIIDHHTVPAADEAHPSYALVNPRRLDSTFPFTGLASVGLAFYVMAALRTSLRDEPTFAGRPLPDVREWLDLVAIGTIADLVPMVGENRVLTSLGLATLARGGRPGLAVLMQAAGLTLGGAVTSKQVAFKLAPRINAPGRIGSARASLELMLATDLAAATALAGELEAANVLRRSWQDAVEGQAKTHAAAYAEAASLVVAGSGWQHGVVGIVAAKLVDAYGKPAFVIAIDEAGVGRGSARSAGGIDVYEALAAAAPWLTRFGGHRAAAGFTVAPQHIEQVRAAIEGYVASAPRSHVRTACDAEVSLRDIDERLVGELEALAPFGPEHPDIRLVLRAATVRQSRRVGDGSHLKLELADASGAIRTAIAFGQGAQAPEVGALVDLVATPVRNVWQGRVRVELEVTAIAPSAAVMAEMGSPLAHAALIG